MPIRHVIVAAADGARTAIAVDYAMVDDDVAGTIGMAPAAVPEVGM